MDKNITDVHLCKRYLPVFMMCGAFVRICRDSSENKSLLPREQNLLGKTAEYTNLRVYSHCTSDIAFDFVKYLWNIFK